MTPFEERMAALRLRFVDRAREECKAIAAATGASLDRDTLRRRAHAIAGSAGLFGFGDIGEEAARLEEAIDEDAPDEQVRALADVLEASLARLA